MGEKWIWREFSEELKRFRTWDGWPFDGWHGKKRGGLANWAQMGWAVGLLGLGLWFITQLKWQTMGWTVTVRQAGRKGDGMCVLCAVCCVCVTWNLGSAKKKAADQGSRGGGDREAGLDEGKDNRGGDEETTRGKWREGA
ncbi:hypothetical protein QBC39DRAFT_360659 [Podospora conica]|nr:hypothetical protein QBC39DRAFT_360659 [Schizothecium conicum]